MVMLSFLLREVVTEFTFGIRAKMIAISIMNNSNLNEKRGALNFFYYYYV